jgi:hypothetical protein
MPSWNCRARGGGRHLTSPSPGAGRWRENPQVCSRGDSRRDQDGPHRFVIATRAATGEGVENELINQHHHASALATGLGRGGQQLQQCRKAYIQSIELLVALANLQTAFVTLDEALKVSAR